MVLGYFLGLIRPPLEARDKGTSIFKRNRRKARGRDVVGEGVASGKGNHTHTYTLTHTKLNLRKASWLLK